MNKLLPRRDAVLDLLATRMRPLSAREIATRLDVSAEMFPGFTRFLEALAQEGALQLLDDGRYALTIPLPPEVLPGPRQDPDEYEGILEMTAGKEGRLRVPGRPEDLRLLGRAVGGALHGDRVLARVLRRGPLGPEGEVLRVLERAPHRVAGTLRRSHSSAWLEPDDLRIRGPIVLQGEVHGRDGDAAVGQITRFPDYPEENPEGLLLVSLGPPGNIRVEEQKILLREEIDELPPAEAQIEAGFLPADPPIQTLQGRDDLTRLPLLGIDLREDGPQDMAFFVERDGQGGHIVWIAAADVAHHVRPGSALDDAARARGSSVFLPRRQVPMLPLSLSQEPCALLPGQLRLALVLSVRITNGADLEAIRFYQAFVRVKARLSLEEATELLEKDMEAQTPELQAADEVAQILHTRRSRRRALDLEEEEVRVRLRDGEPTAVERAGDSSAERRALGLLRELVLLSGEAAGKFLAERGLAAPYRIQPPPDPAKIRVFFSLCERAGLPMENPTSDLQGLALHLRRIRRHPWSAILMDTLRRALPEPSWSMSQGEYFSLALPAFSPFCAPLARYAELLVQRVLIAALTAEQRGYKLIQEANEEAQLACHLERATKQERKIASVEQEVLEVYRMRVLGEHIGETLEGQVTGVTSEGVVVTTSSPFAEVRIKADALGRDRYKLDEHRLRFHGRNGDSVGLGDRVVVTIEEVTLGLRQAYGWRHTHDMADREPLRHTPFRSVAKKRATANRARR
ncbi:MAG: ribonuclease R [Myxococcales bacterium]|nr:ribonuclease R [Polyangiaceae bacterium]MDW8249898.1 ribonuclease R [Myxococcales bacterium]